MGKKDSVDLALRLTSKGSRIVIFGLCDKKDNIDVNLQELFLKEVSINFSYLNPFKFVNAIELLETHRVKVNHLISEKISLSDAENAFEKIRNSHFLKYQIINSKKEVA